MADFPRKSAVYILRFRAIHAIRSERIPIPEWFDWTAGAASIAGLGYAWWASRQATGAKDAAQRAERSVRRHNAEVDFGSLARMAKELHGYVEGGMMSEARLRTTDLRSELASAIRLHEVFLGNQREQLEGKQYDLTLVAAGLNRRAGDLSQLEKARLLGITGAILDLLAGQCGKLRSSVEKGASNG
jgi:hypothetical protein